MATQSKAFKELVALQKEFQDKRDNLEELKQKLQKSPFSQMASRIVVEPKGFEKMSDILTEFLEPYMDLIESKGKAKNLFQLGILAWNTSLLPENQQGEMIKNLFAGDEINSISADFKNEIIDFFHELIARKKKYFPHINRLVTDFNLKDLGGDELHLSVASSLVEVNLEDLSSNNSQ